VGFYVLCGKDNGKTNRTDEKIKTSEKIQSAQMPLKLKSGSGKVAKKCKNCRKEKNLQLMLIG